MDASVWKLIRRGKRKTGDNKDYDWFVELFGNREFEDCVMVNETTFSEYRLAFTKFISLKKYGFVNNLNRFPHHLSEHGIDIFPLDHGSDTKTWARAIGFYRDVLLYKQKYIVPQGWRLMRKLPIMCSGIILTKERTAVYGKS